VDGITATLDESKDPIQPAFSTWNFSGNMRNETQQVKTDNIRDVEATEFFVVRDVQEDSVWIRRQRHA
jgi:hypothetical protein